MKVEKAGENTRVNVPHFAELKAKSDNNGD